MEDLRVKDIVGAVKGKLLCGDENMIITSATTNSKEVMEGGLFIPIIGERVDGHEFINSAFESGAVATFTSHDRPIEALDQTKAYIQVEDCVLALQELGAYYRDKFEIPIIGITGSVGKTTTKEMIAIALETKYKVLKTAGNMNSQIGLPLMMLRLKKDHELAVIEMGISEEGEMTKLSTIAKPSTAVITNIGVSHIAQLGSKENIRKEKLNIINEFDQNGNLYLNGNDALLCELVNEEWKEKINTTKVYFFGTTKSAPYYGENIRVKNDRTYFTYIYPGGSEEIVLSVLGIHNVWNALVALAIAEQYGIPPSIAKKGLHSYKPIAMRGQIYKKNGLQIIDDTYNASPDSMKSGIGVLLALEGVKKRYAVLADVLELGDLSWQCHYDVGTYIAQLKENSIDGLITVGEQAKAIGKAIEDAKVPIQVQSFDKNIAAIDFLKSYVKEGDAILVKGSRGMHTEEIVNAMIE
jgi:UDP-N-acetylmuramoyl-tripeptide--D-alanyl-D-alanine ligase